MSSASPETTRRAWLIWSAGAFVYLLAVFHRTSFGVAGLQAADRFGVGAAMLGSFTVLQVAVYAAMQIPTGVLVDRFGPRRVLIGALLFLGLGQTLLALADSYWLGLLARGVLGFGDALAFVSVLRLAATHFPPRRYSLVTTLTSALGFVGNLAATVPLAILLPAVGWTPVFLGAGVVTVAYVLVVWFAVRDGGPAVRHTASPRQIAGQVAAAWRTPGTRVGFWTHFSGMVAPTTLTLLWGVPYLRAQGLSATTASSVLSVMVIVSMIGGPVLGAAVSRRPSIRMPLVIGYAAVSLALWAMLLAAPSVPVWVLFVAFAVLATGAPVSTVGFMLARDYNPLPRVGTATGVVNVAGFVSTSVAALAVGVLLQVTGGNFRIAMLAIVVLLVGGTWRLIVWYRRARASVLAAQARGEDVPVRLRRRSWDAEALGDDPQTPDASRAVGADASMVGSQ